MFCEPPFLRSTLIVKGPVGMGSSLGLRTRCSPSLFSRMSGVVLLPLADWGCASFSAIPYAAKSIVLRLSTWSPDPIVSSCYVMGRITARAVDAPTNDQHSPHHFASCGHPDNELAEVASLQDSDERPWRVFETVDNVLAVANATRGDARSNLAQEVSIMLAGEVVVDEAAYGRPLRENLPHGGGKSIRTVARWDAVVLRNEPGDRNARKIVEQW